MAVLLAVVVMALLGVFTGWLAWAAKRSQALDRLIGIVAMAGQMAPFSGRETLGGWRPACPRGEPGDSRL
jgi:hypothetical protein